MELLFIVLVIPLAGGLLLLLDRQRVQGLDRLARDSARSCLSWLGAVIIAHGTGYLVFTLWQILKLLGQAQPIEAESLLLQTLGRLLVAASLIVTGWTARRVSLHEECDGLELTERFRRQLEVDRLFNCEMLLIALPLLIPGGVLLFLCLGLIAAWEFSTAFQRSLRTNRLLWTLSLASANGRPLAQEIQFLAERERSRHWRHRYQDLANDLLEGSSLSAALLPHAWYLPRHLLAMIAVAEEQGTLPTVLDGLAQRHTSALTRAHGDQGVMSMVVGFWFLTLIIINVCLSVCFWIIPKYKSIYNDFDVQLPEVTVSFIHACDFFATYWFLLMPLVALPAALPLGAYLLTVGAESGRAEFLGRFWPRMHLPSLLRMIAVTVQNAAPLPEALEIVAALQLHPAQMLRLKRVQARLRLGDELGASLWDGRFVSTRQAHALKEAERMRQLPWTLNALADQIERRRRHLFIWFVELTRPLMIMLIGMIVLFFCVAMFSPIIKMMEELS